MFKPSRMAFAVSAAVLLLSGCASRETTPTLAQEIRGEAATIQAEAQRRAQIADNLERGERLITTGERNVERKQREVARLERRLRDTERDLERARRELQAGQESVAEGRRLVAESERNYQQLLEQATAVPGTVEVVDPPTEPTPQRF